VPSVWNKEQAELLRRIALAGNSCAADECQGSALDALIEVGFVRPRKATASALRKPDWSALASCRPAVAVMSGIAVEIYPSNTERLSIIFTWNVARTRTSITATPSSCPMCGESVWPGMELASLDWRGSADDAGPYPP
jgi:hypothetical protein